MLRNMALLSIVSLPASLLATTHSNMTFLTPRAPGNQTYLTYATGNHTKSAVASTKHGSSIQVTAQYQSSLEKGKLGQYFGYWAAQEGKYRDYIQVVAPADAGFVHHTKAEYDTNVKDNIWAEYLVHNTTGDGNLNISDKLQFKPTQERYQVRFDFHHNLTSIAHGTYFEMALPVVQVKNSMGLTRIGDHTAIAIANHPALGKTLIDYFKGDVYNYDTAAAGNTQQQQHALLNAKIDQTHSRTGIANITTKLGYNFTPHKKSWTSIYLTSTIPTSDHPTGEFVFEPLCGNGNFWVFGTGIDTKQALWHNTHATVFLTAAVNLYYHLPTTQKRTLGLKKNDGTSIPMSQYYGLGEVMAIGTAVSPCANITTLDLKVSPGFMGDGLISLSFTGNTIGFDCGYNLFAKQQEDLKLKNAWPENRYVVAGDDYPTNRALDTAVPGNENADNYTWEGSQTIKETNLDFKKASTPTQWGHVIYAALSAQTTSATPLNLGIGGSYEMGQSNADINNYSLWASLSYAF